MANKRTLYGTLGIAAMGLMSSSFFSNALTGGDHGMISLSSDTAAASPSTDKSTDSKTPANKDATRASNSGRAQAQRTQVRPGQSVGTNTPQGNGAKKPSPGTPLPKSASGTKVKRVQRAAVKSTAQAPAEEEAQPQTTTVSETPTTTTVPAPADDLSDKGTMDVNNDVQYAFEKTGENKNDEIHYGTDDKVQTSGLRSLTFEVTRVSKTEGTTCDGSDECTEGNSQKVSLSVNKGDSIRAALRAALARTESVFKSNARKKQDERIAKCDEVSDQQLHRADGDHEVAMDLCQEARFGSLKNKDDDKSEKEDIFEHLKEEIVRLVKESKDDRKALRLAKALVSNAKGELKSKLQLTLEAAQYDVKAETDLAAAKKQDADIAKELNAANQICPASSTMNNQPMNNQMANTNLNQNMNPNCMPGTQGYMMAQAYKADALNRLSALANQEMAYAPSNFQNMNYIASNPMDGGLNVDQMKDEFQLYRGFAGDVSADLSYIYGRQIQILSQQDMSLMGISNSQQNPAFGQPGMNNYGMNSNMLSMNNLDMNTWRTAQRNGVTIPMTIPQPALQQQNGGFMNQQGPVGVPQLNNPLANNTYTPGSTYTGTGYNQIAAPSVVPNQFAQTSAGRTLAR